MVKRKQRIPDRMLDRGTFQQSIPSKALNPPGPSVTPPLQVRPEPEPPSPEEQAVLDLLWREYRKSDAAAKAAARFERDVHAELVQQRKAEGFEADEAGDVQQVFRADEFNTTFRQLLQLRMEIALIGELGLQQYEADIMQERIRSTFGKRTGTKQIVLPSQDQLQLGSPEQRHVQDLKRRGRRR